MPSESQLETEEDACEDETRHLVLPLRRMSLDDGLKALRQAHAFIVRHATLRLNSQMKSVTGQSATWGCDFKRIEIALPTDDQACRFTGSDGRNHRLIGDVRTPQKLIEVINQAATLERLMDAIRWSMTENCGLCQCTIGICHPTTSSTSTGSELPDHDLVLIGPNGTAAVFEVSDVASLKDGNRKEEKDLTTLGLLSEGKGEEKFRVDPWPAHRLFLVVSSEWKKRLGGKSRRWVKARTVNGIQIPPHIITTLVSGQAETGIFELHPDKGFGIQVYSGKQCVSSAMDPD